MSMRDVIKKLEAKHEAAERQVSEYDELVLKAKDEDARMRYLVEKNFWLGMAYASQAALAVAVQEEVTGGTPF